MQDVKFQCDKMLRSNATNVHLNDSSVQIISSFTVVSIYTKCKNCYSPPSIIIVIQLKEIIFLVLIKAMPTGIPNYLISVAK